MTSRAVIKGRPLVSPLHALEDEGRKAVTEAADQTLETVRHLTPRDTGRLAARTVRRVSRTGTGVQATVRPHRSDFYYWFVERGTGEFGPFRRRIRPRHASAFLLGRTGRHVVESVRGQRAQRVYERAKAIAAPKAEDIIARGGQRAADRIARELQ